MDCAAALIPKIEIASKSRLAQNAWLKHVSESSFNELKKNSGVDTGGTAGLPIQGIPAQFSGFFKGSWSDFQEQRSSYLSLEENQSSEATTEALFRQSLSAEQLKAWISCVTDQRGLFVILFDDSVESVVADIYYKGDPGSVAKIEVAITNGAVDGKSKPKSFALPSGSNRRFLVKRSTSDADVAVIANTSTLGASATSIWPLPAPEVAKPTIDPHRHDGPAGLVSQGRPTNASSGDASAAVDANSTSAWNSGGFPPQWIEVLLDGEHDVDRVELIPEQNPTVAVTRHIISGMRPSGERVLIDDFTGVTGLGTKLIILTDPKSEGWGLTRIRVETVASPSWVAWRDLQVYGWKL